MRTGIAAALPDLWSYSGSVDVHVLTNGVERHGVEIVPFSSPQFRQASQGLIASASAEGDLDPWLPFSYVLLNMSSRHVILHSTSVSNYYPPTGKTVAYTNTWSSLDPRDTLGPGATRLVIPPSSMSNLLPRLEQQRSRPEGVTVSVEAILFDDGGFCGPDHRHAVEQIRGVWQGEREIHELILTASDDPKALQELEALAAGPRPEREMGTFEGKYQTTKWSKARLFLFQISRAGLASAIAMVEQWPRKVYPVVRRLE